MKKSLSNYHSTLISRQQEQRDAEYGRVCLMELKAKRMERKAKSMKRNIEENY